MSISALAGSVRQAYRDARSTGKARPDERLEVTVLVRRQQADELAARVRKIAAGDRSQPHMTHAAFEAAYGASAADIAAVEKFAHTHGLAAVEQHAGRRSIVLSGTVAQFNAAFGVDLQHFDYDGGSYRGRTGPVHLPAELQGVVEAVLGLDNRPAAKPHFRRRAAAGTDTSFTPLQVADLYNFPAGTGAGQCIGLIELGGGYRTKDLATYFSESGVSPAPKVTAVSVDHAKNHATGSGNGPDGEVMLDIEVAGSIAPGAHIAVYFAPNTDAGFLDAVTTAVHDTTNKPSVISISWGGPESTWTAQSTAAFDSAFQAAAALGITILVAAGDNGSSDGVTDGANHVDFPASSPHATACGGTRIATSGTAITEETVWNDGATGGAGGGGISTVFPVPTWQSGLSATGTAGTQALTMRGVPDIAGDADPQSGYDVRVDGQETVIGGTSAVAPLWAGMIARINALQGTQAGLINPTLYANPTALNDITTGNNGAFSAAPGWDACTGLGSPIGNAIAKLFQPVAASQKVT
jgi:kumamolisin